MRRALVVGLLLMADLLGAGQLDQVGDEQPDYLGRAVSTAFRNQPALPTGGAVGKASAPASVGGSGATTPLGTRTPGAPAEAGSAGPSTLQQIARALGLSQEAFKASKWAKDLFGDPQSAGPTAEKIDAGQIVPESFSLTSEGAGPTATAIDTGQIVPESSSLMADSGAGAGEGSPLAAILRLGMGAYQTSQADTDQAKAAEAAHAVGMALADYWTAGAAELGPMIGKFIGEDNPIGALLTGAPALLNPDLGKSRHTMLEQRASTQAEKEVEAIHEGFSHVPQDNLGATFGALRTQLDPKGAVRSGLDPKTATELGVPPEWTAMSPEQFSSVMQWMSSDPSRLSSVVGSGDVPYLNQFDAGRYGDRAASTARALIARELGLPYLQPRDVLDPSTFVAHSGYDPESGTPTGEFSYPGEDDRLRQEAAYQKALDAWHANRVSPQVAPMTPEAAIPAAFPADDLTPTATMLTGGGLRERELLGGE